MSATMAWRRRTVSCNAIPNVCPPSIRHRTYCNRLEVVRHGLLCLMARSPGRPGTAGRDGKLVSRNPWPLVGRIRELGAIERFLTSASGALVFSGAAGAGKTRLINEIEVRSKAVG